MHLRLNEHWSEILDARKAVIRAVATAAIIASIVAVLEMVRITNWSTQRVQSSQPTQRQIAYNYSAVVEDLTSRLSQIMRTQAEACDPAAFTIDRCATAAREAGYAIAEVEDRMAALIVPDCLQRVDASIRLTLNDLGIGYLGAAAGMSHHNQAMVVMSLNSIREGNEVLLQTASTLRSAASACETNQ